MSKRTIDDVSTDVEMAVAWRTKTARADDDDDAVCHIIDTLVHDIRIVLRRWYLGLLARNRLMRTCKQLAAEDDRLFRLPHGDGNDALRFFPPKLETLYWDEPVHDLLRWLWLVEDFVPHLHLLPPFALIAGPWSRLEQSHTITSKRRTIGEVWFALPPTPQCKKPLICFDAVVRPLGDYDIIYWIMYMNTDRNKTTDGKNPDLHHMGIGETLLEFVDLHHLYIDTWAAPPHVGWHAR